MQLGLASADALDDLARAAAVWALLAVQLARALAFRAGIFARARRALRRFVARLAWLGSFSRIGGHHRHPFLDLDQLAKRIDVSHRATRGGDWSKCPEAGT
jgi:hypothetical protein